MARTREFDDGTTIELRWSGNGNEPDAPAGRQHTNCSTLWLRVDGGAWRLVQGHRSEFRAWEWIAAAETAAEVLPILCPAC